MVCALSVFVCLLLKPSLPHSKALNFNSTTGLHTTPGRYPSLDAAKLLYLLPILQTLGTIGFLALQKPSSPCLLFGHPYPQSHCLRAMERQLEHQVAEKKSYKYQHLNQIFFSLQNFHLCKRVAPSVLPTSPKGSHRKLTVSNVPPVLLMQNTV